MGSAFRCALTLALVVRLTQPAAAQPERCTQEALRVDGAAVQAKFCVPAGAGPPSVSVSETFSAHEHSVARTITLPVVAGAAVSRTIDDVDLNPLGIKRSLHMTLTFRDGAVELEHALALPGATPIK